MFAGGISLRCEKFSALKAGERSEQIANSQIA